MVQRQPHGRGQVKCQGCVRRPSWTKVMPAYSPIAHSQNEGIQNYLQGLTPTDATDYSLWKGTRKIKQPQHQIPPIRINRNTWARTDKQKATAFAEHLTSVFQPFPSQLSAMDEETIKNELNAPHQMALRMKKIRINEVINVIKYKIHPKKSPSYDLITGKILQELSQNDLTAITQIYNAILLDLKLRRMYWIIGRKSELSLENKLPI